MMYEMEVSEREHCFSTKEGFGKPAGEWKEVAAPGENSQHNGVIKAFTNKILNGSALVANGEEGIYGLSLSNAMHLSSWLHTAVELPVDEELFLEELTKRRKTSKKKKEASGVTFDTEGTYGS